MTGKVIYRPGPVCECGPPTLDDDHTPAEPVGTVWKCDNCRAVWRACTEGWRQVAWT